MMVLHRDTGFIEHRDVRDIAEYLREGDLLVVNDTKVFPARLNGTWRDSSGAVEMLLVSPLADGEVASDGPETRLDAPPPESALSWAVMIGSGRPCREGQTAVFGPHGELAATLRRRLDGGLWRVEFACDGPLMSLLDGFGRIPVPPYVHRKGTPEEEAEDRKRYQTIYARETGSVAAPTAGLHFTPEIFASIDAKGVQRAAVTLHVGPGTFRPVKCDDIEDHVMDFEVFTIPPETANAIAECRKRGGRVVCTGSTTVRTLETVAAANGGTVVAGHGASNLFIYPPYRFRVCDAMLTNFHLPRSTLLMMIAAVAGRERVLCAYNLAVGARYRFFSYGDCMLIV